MKSRTLVAALLAAAILVAAAIGAWTSSSWGAAAPPGGEPLTAARFELTIDGHSLAVFSDSSAFRPRSTSRTSGRPETEAQAEEAARQANAPDRRPQAWHDPQHRALCLARARDSG